MRTFEPTWIVACLLVISLSLALDASATAQSIRSGATESRFALPRVDRPIVVRTRVDLHEINAIDDESETVEFTADIVAWWRDPLRAFDPALVGVDELVYQGTYQVHEIAAGWFPQLVFVNGSSEFDIRGELLRVRPDGTTILVRSVSGVAEIELDLIRFPFDAQRFELFLQVLGFFGAEVRLEAAVEGTALPDLDVRVPQWSITGVRQEIRERSVVAGEPGATAPALVVTIDAERRSLYLRRLVVLPLFVIVVLSFSVFWMDRSSLADRMNVSFIGILTVVAYQAIVNDTLPRISTFTLMHGFLATSFLTTALAVVINLAVSWADRRGRNELGDRIDRRCRWLFPVGYVGVLLSMIAAVFVA